MSDISRLEKLFFETNQLILKDLERISKIWNEEDDSHVGTQIKSELDETMQDQILIDKSFEFIRQNILEINVNYDKYVKYYENMKDLYLKTIYKIEKANNLKKKVTAKNDRRIKEIKLAYLAPYLSYLFQLTEISVIKTEKSGLYTKLASFYYNKSEKYRKTLVFQSMPNLVQAKKLYYQAWKLNEENLSAAFGLAKCLQKLSKFKICIEFLTLEFKTKQSQNGFKDYHYIKAICYRKTADYEKAEAEITLALEIDTKNGKIQQEKYLINRLALKHRLEGSEKVLFKETENDRKLENKQDYAYRHHESKDFRILSIDGGGIRGIVPAYWACEIEKRAHKPIAYLFNMLAGTSTGGIISAGLSYPDTNGYSPKYRAYELLDVYRHRGTDIFPLHNWLMGKLHTAKSIIGSKHKDKGRKDLFDELLGKARISSSLTELVIPAANEDYILSTHLFNRFDARYDETYNDYYVDALMSTSAAPYYFPSYEIKNKGLFLDGGIHVNNPAGVACAEAVRYGISHHNICLISMGTGAYIPGLLDESSWRSMVFSNETNLKNRGALYWAAHLKDVGLEGQCGNTDIAMYESLGSKYTRMQVWFENEITMDQCDEANITLLTDIASQYIEEKDLSEENSVNKLVESLLKDEEF